MVFIDTHIAVWLYNNTTERFSAAGRKALETDDIVISPVCMLELEFLHEIGKIIKRPGDIIALLSELINLRIDDIPLAELIESAVREKWTRDPFDRMIVAHARRRNCILISADRTIQKRYKKTLL